MEDILIILCRYEVNARDSPGTEDQSTVELPVDASR